MFWLLGLTDRHQQMIMAGPQSDIASSALAAGLHQYTKNRNHYYTLHEAKIVSPSPSSLSEIIPTVCVIFQVLGVNILKASYVVN